MDKEKDIELAERIADCFRRSHFNDIDTIKLSAEEEPDEKEGMAKFEESLEQSGLYWPYPEERETRLRPVDEDAAMRKTIKSLGDQIGLPPRDPEAHVEFEIHQLEQKANQSSYMTVEEKREYKAMQDLQEAFKDAIDRGGGTDL